MIATKVKIHAFVYHPSIRDDVQQWCIYCTHPSFLFHLLSPLYVKQWEASDIDEEEEEKHISLYRQHRLWGPWVGDSFTTSSCRGRIIYMKLIMKKLESYLFKFIPPPPCEMIGLYLLTFSTLAPSSTRWCSKWVTHPRPPEPVLSI